MIKLSANLSKKVPIPGLEYSSQQFGASMEIEVSDADMPHAIQARIHELYALLSNSIDPQIAGATQCPEKAPPPPVSSPPVQHRQRVPQQLPQPSQQQRVGYANGRNRVAAVTNGSGANGNGRRVTATEAQVKYVYALTKSLGLDLKSVLAGYKVSAPDDLFIRDCSSLIESLKAQQNSNGAAA